VCARGADVRGCTLVRSQVLVVDRDQRPPRRKQHVRPQAQHDPDLHPPPAPRLSARTPTRARARRTHEKMTDGGASAGHACGGGGALRKKSGRSGKKKPHSSPSTIGLVRAPPGSGSPPPPACMSSIHCSSSARACSSAAVASVGQSQEIGDAIYRLQSRARRRARRWWPAARGRPSACSRCPRRRTQRPRADQSHGLEPALAVGIGSQRGVSREARAAGSPGRTPPPPRRPRAPARRHSAATQTL
jgi:hypothetical protein